MYWLGIPGRQNIALQKVENDAQPEVARVKKDPGRREAATQTEEAPELGGRRDSRPPPGHGLPEHEEPGQGPEVTKQAKARTYDTMQNIPSKRRPSADEQMTSTDTTGFDTAFEEEFRAGA